jgi:hypothetical protein
MGGWQAQKFTERKEKQNTGQLYITAKVKELKQEL